MKEKYTPFYIMLLYKSVFALKTRFHCLFLVYPTMVPYLLPSLSNYFLVQYVSSQTVH